MFGRLRRVAAALVLAPFLIFGSGLAPQHAHESDAGHAHAVVHGHFEPHQLVSHDDHTPEVDHDEHVIWIDVAVIHALPFQFDAPSAVLMCVPEIVTRSSSWSAIAFDDSAPPHGPPRLFTSLRAPPILPA